MDGEEHGAFPTQSPGEPSRDFRGDLGGSGWTTTKQAAKVLGVSRRSVQGYVSRGILEAREEGEGVNRRFLISIDSLNSLVDRRRREADEAANFADASPQSEDAATSSANAGEGLRHLIERLEARTAEATEFRMHLEITERAQSTLEDDLAEARQRLEEAQRERDELRRELGALKEGPSDAERPPGATSRSPTTQDAGAELNERREEPAGSGRVRKARGSPRWRRAILLAGLSLGIVAVWFVAVMVGLILLQP